MASEEKEASPKSAPSQNLAAEYFQNLAENSFRDSTYFEDSQRKPYNPDDLYQKKGNYETYEDMMHDEQVSVAMQLKKDLVIGSGWEIASEDEGQDEVVEFLNKTLVEDLEEPLEDQLEGVISAYDYGFSLSEKIFKKRDDGKVTLKIIKTRYPDSWLIHTDKKGNIEKYEQRADKSTLEVDPKILIHYINNPKFQNPYGTSDLRSAYQAWFSKTHLMRYYSIFLEKAASPIPVAKYKTGVTDTAVNKIFDTIKRFQAKTAIAIPDTIEVEFLNHQNRGEAYIAGLNIFNMFIGRALFIPDLLGFQGGETAGGAYALGKEHMNLFFRHINRRRTKLENIINKQIIMPIVAWNFGNIENPPKFKFKPLSDEDAINAAKIWLEAVKGKFYKPNDEEISHFRQLVKFPDGAVEREEPQPNPLLTGQVGAEEQAEDKVKQKDQKENDKGKEAKKPADKPENEKKEFKAYRETEGDYSKKVNFKALETQLENTHNTIIAEAKPIVKEIVSDLLDQIEKKKIVQNQKIERIDDLKLKYLKRLQLLLKTNFKDHFKKNQILAQEEIFGTKNFREPLPTEMFLDFLETETYKFIGDWEYRVTAQAKQEIIKAIKDGRPISAVLDMIESDGTKSAMESLERYSRTKETEVMNRARMEFFDSTGVVEGYQYSAIMDAVTSDICAELHGQTFEKGQEVVPPTHFNCRSTLIPITKFEDAKYPTESEMAKLNARIDKQLEKTGFSRR